MFWGCVVAPGAKPTPFVPPPDGSRLHISQATLGPGAKDGARVALRVRTGEEDAESILLCAFRAGFSETTQLDILLSEYAELSVEGSTAIHVTGYYMPDFGEGGMEDDDEDEDEEDDDEFGFPVGYDVDEDDDDEEDSDEEDSDEDEEDGLRPRKKSGVVIKELPAGAGADDGDEEEEEEEEEEDSEDDAPPASAGRGKPNPADHAKNFLPLCGDGKKRPAAAPTTATPPAKKAAPSPAPAASPAASKPAASPTAGAAGGKIGSQFSDGPAGTLGSRKFDNGLEIINLAAGKPDGKVALMGKRVQMKYVGRLKSNGKVFDASKGAPFTFRLGVGEVIKGWDIGVKGMRVGDKRKLVIPPDMGYGKKGASGAIPPNAWLEFDIELVNVLG